MSLRDEILNTGLGLEGDLLNTIPGDFLLILMIGRLTGGLEELLMVPLFLLLLLALGLEKFILVLGLLEKPLLLLLHMVCPRFYVARLLQGRLDLCRLGSRRWCRIP